MKKQLAILLAAGFLVATADAASAQWYGGGYYYDHPGYRYREPYYGGYGYRGLYGYGGAILGYDIFGRPEWYYPVGPYGRCPRHYTVQDGLCKPYRGF